MVAIILILLILAFILRAALRKAAQNKKSASTAAYSQVRDISSLRARQSAWKAPDSLIGHALLFARIGEYTYKCFPEKSANLKIINYNGFSGTDISFYDHGETLKWCRETAPGAQAYLEKICSVCGRNGEYQYDYDSTSEKATATERDAGMLAWTPEQYLEQIKKAAPHAQITVRYLNADDPILSKISKGYCLDIYFCDETA